MEYQEYKSIYNRLNCPNDFEKLELEGYDPRLLRTMYTQKISRDVKKRFYVVKQNTPRILKEWKKGKTMMQLSDEWKFPPILMAMFIFMEDGASKKEFWSYINDPDQLSKKTADEIRDVAKNDLIYSPEANEEQKQRGLWGESLLHDWLDKQNIKYRTEDEIRGAYEKTPDALLNEPMMYNGHKIYWVESKASFGDNTEFRFNSRKQLIPYTKIFGPGIVVYWVGCLNDLECPEDVFVEDINVLEKTLSKCSD